MKKAKEELGKHALQLGIVVFTAGVITPMFQGNVKILYSVIALLLWVFLVSIGVYLLSEDE